MYMCLQGDVVTAFASSNLGDVSPNIKGPKCVNSGEVCDNVQSTCNGEAKYCIAFGPGKDMFESTKIIANRLFNKGLVNNFTVVKFYNKIKLNICRSYGQVKINEK